MLNIIGKKNLYFLISLLLIIPGIISLLVFGLKLSIDFTGGTRTTYVLPGRINSESTNVIRKVYTDNGVTISSIQPSANGVIVRTPPLTDAQNRKVVQGVQQEITGSRQESTETIGPTIGREITENALKSIGLASLLIVLYLAWSFRKVPKPANGWRFGVIAVVTLIHDILLLLGVFSILGKLFNVEVDSLFITALLTVMGFSVHDTIVVFDRIRENLLRGGTSQFAQTVNDSILQTLTRSLGTSLTALLVLFGLLLFGGESIRWFVVALLIGIASGTFSSIFNAAPLLVLWQEWEEKTKKRVKG